MAKKKAKPVKKEDLNDEDVISLQPEEDSFTEDFPEEEIVTQEDDDAAYTMGDIIVDEGSSEEAEEEDKQILKQKETLTPQEGEEDVWVDEVDVFDDSDPYLEGADFDPENAGDYYD